MEPLTRVVRVTPETISEAAGILNAGGLVAFPTETVYGLGAVATDATAVQRLFGAKGRPSSNPLIVHVPGRAEAADLAFWTPPAEALAAAFWPGALSLVLRLNPAAGIASEATASLDTVALRAPAEPTAQALLATCARPVAAPSANRSGGVSPTRAGHVVDGLGGRIDLVLDAGPCRIGIESTVVDVTGPAPRLLRPGGVTREALEALLGTLGTDDSTGDGGVLRSPGQLSSHYAPLLPVRLDATSAAADEAFLGFGGRDVPGAAVSLDLSPSGDLDEAARNLFAMLRELDRPGLRAIAVAPIPVGGLGDALGDRLRRAAAARPVARA
ncbi:MAG: L-threonylcarbamoyladenylate synthase [Pseudomonadota bacterium]